MVTQPLALPRMYREQADVRNQLAAGLTLPFSREDRPGEIRLTLAENGGVEPLSHWRCDDGIFALSSPAPVLSLLSDCPLLPETDKQAAQEWYWTLYNQSLAPSVAAVLGQLFPHPAPRTAEIAVAGWLTVSWNGIRTRSRIQASTAWWRALLKRPGWRRIYPALPHSLPFAVPLILADAVLTPETLSRLGCGDVILPTTPYFSPAGQGSITLAQRRLHGAARLAGLAPYHFVIADMEIIPMNDSFNDAQAQQTAHDEISDIVTNKNSMDQTEPARLPPLPVTLNIRCGQITFTLPELQRLASGSVLTLRDVVLGEAWLCHGDIPLAHGELIDIEGKLGLQITRLLSTADAPARQESEV
ncbi:type III secretion system cytoplasmic ring protein SctQ [Brenneria izadpanahii]|uniref:Type III secretion system cytoplasmic ring protein SctQ n=1 Tax=Brenneria izadpanahii TaxID=2722756 RepID=A0ABX7US24_9GAMM|nr:type III secretion system cytoplasmic ring protein SctQ [Brenneria izadpanahii]QTF08175.1 type III secretion system cytoplasmic ring protein SctQ [Brenneria izadpanahii]